VIHTPPPAGELESRLAAMCKFANGAEQKGFLHPLLRAVILHFWLAYDHPFVDGNGRTARALFYWSMLSNGYWLTEFISISRILRKAPVKYPRSFLHSETDGNDVTYFVIYQLSVIQRAIKDLYLYLEIKAKELRQTERLLRGSQDLNHRQVALLSHALKHPDFRYTIRSHQGSHGVVYQTARSDLLDLARRGLLEQRRAGRGFVFYRADDLAEKIHQRGRRPSAVAAVEG
jgi:Fic family protein